ncbi:MAG TPA: hypothetical protein DCX06_07350 [Opitutae bacterium]|nr:hypothetical protein [Opitutae bacterium]
MTFENPAWLYFAVVITLITTGMIALGLRKREQLLGNFAATRLLDQLTEKASQTRTLFKAALITMGIAAVAIAIARPQYGVEWSERKARGLDIVFVLDSSKSMLATDMRPTRLDRAKLAVIDLIERLESDRIGLVAFAGRAFLQTPPTLDYSAFRESLDSVGPGTMTSGGSDLGNAIKEAEKAFPKDNNFKVIILLTDGEDLGGNSIETAKQAATNGIKVYAIGIGTPEGEYLRIRNERGEEEFIRDDQGQPVRSQLDESTLQQIAQATGGSYSRLSSQSLEALYASVIATLPREERDAELQETPIERYQWLIGAAILFLVVEIIIRRRGNVRIHAALLVFTCISVLPQHSEAQEEPPLNISEEAIDDPLPEPELPKDPRITYNQAYEALTAGDLEAAQTLYQTSIAQTEDLKLQRDALYNLAHSNYQAGRQTYDSGDLDSAIELIKAAEALFQSAQEIDPNDTAAAEDEKKVKAVREAIEKLKQQQEEQQDQENQDSEPQDEQEQSKENQEQQNQDGDSSEQNQENSETSEDQSEENQNSQQQDPQNQDGENQQQQDQQNQSSEDGEQSEQESSQGENGEPNDEESDSQSGQEQSEEESTRDPAEDMAQQEQDAQEEAEQNGEQGSAAQPTEGEANQSEQEGQQGAGQAMQIEGMSQEDAAALLESLRDGEKLLPFVEQGTPRNRGKVRDW